MKPLWRVKRATTDATQEYAPYGNGGGYPPPFGEAWRAPAPYNPQQAQPQRRDVYGQPY